MEPTVMDGRASAAPDACAETAQSRPRRPDPCAFVVFGATGDLARRKLMPALYNLAGDGLLDDRFALLGVGREAMTGERYQEKLERELQEHGSDVDAARVHWLSRRAAYVAGELDDEATYRRLSEHLRERAAAPGHAIFYLATPPSLFELIIERLSAAGLLDESRAWRRVVIEKPFGRDLASARALNQRLLALMQEHQAYRIDHYLGKETVQNIMAFRFGNGIFEPIWNRRYIDHVQITVAETVGVEQRGGYYDTAGALRDMVQNHLFQLLAVTAMEPPGSFSAEPVRNERLKVLQAVRRFTDASARRDVVRGQYASGEVAGRAVVAYRQEPKVARESETETYLALKVLVDNWRWSDVPIYLRTGKRLRARVTEIVVQFKRAPLALFPQTPVECMQPNRLVLQIQPREAISLQFEAKVPGPRMQLDAVKMHFCYEDYFGRPPRTGYETLLYDCMVGDATLFHRADIVEAGWDIVAPVLDAWQATAGTPVPDYLPGSWGPADAAALLDSDGRAWHDPLG